MTQCKVKVNARFIKAKDELSDQAGNVLMITPPIDENYWIYRVDLKCGQAIVAFPKFGMIGCGFAKEKDWNTNLPISCPADEIYRHIAHNKGSAKITKAECIAAIKAIQRVAKNRERP